MTYHVSELDETFNTELLELAEMNNTGSEQFRVDRTPNFFKLSAELGDTKHFGLFRQGSLIGSIAVSTHQRVINGNVEDVYYLNDLRIHPEYHGTLAFYRIIKYLFQRYTDEGKVKWMFSTMLNSNRHRPALTKGIQMIPHGKVIGTTIHVGIPLFQGRRQLNSDVLEIDGDAAWEAYQTFAQHSNFAPMDKGIFTRENGTFLAFRENKEIVAVSKLVDQSKARKLRLAGPLSPVLRIVNVLCRVKGCPPLPREGGVFKHAYLSLYAAKKPSCQYRETFVAYIRKHYYREYTYLFYGISEEEAKNQAKVQSIFQTTLSSTTYGYGDIPQHLTFDFHEISLI